MKIYVPLLVSKTFLGILKNIWHISFYSRSYYFKYKILLNFAKKTLIMSVNSLITINKQKNFTRNWHKLSHTFRCEGMAFYFFFDNGKRCQYQNKTHGGYTTTSWPTTSLPHPLKPNFGLRLTNLSLKLLAGVWERGVSSQYGHCAVQILSELNAVLQKF